MQKIVTNLLLFIVLLGMLMGCGSTENEIPKVKDLDYTVVTAEQIPEELKVNLEERKAEAFKVTYVDKGYFYICVGYGEQQTGGYSITVKDMYLTNNAIYVDTSLCGPTPEESKNIVKSYPYIVLKTEYIDKTVVFE